MPRGHNLQPRCRAMVSLRLTRRGGGALPLAEALLQSISTTYNPPYRRSRLTSAASTCEDERLDVRFGNLAGTARAGDLRKVSPLRGSGFLTTSLEHQNELRSPTQCQGSQCLFEAGTSQATAAAACVSRGGRNTFTRVSPKAPSMGYSTVISAPAPVPRTAMTCPTMSENGFGRRTASPSANL